MSKPAMERLENAPPPLLMTDDEAKAVLQLWAERQNEAEIARPSVKDLSEALRLPEEYVATMLAEVREKAKPRVVATPVYVAPRRPAWLILVMALVLLVGVAGLFLTSSQPPVITPAPGPVISEVPAGFAAPSIATDATIAPPAAIPDSLTTDEEELQRLNVEIAAIKVKIQENQKLLANEQTGGQPTYKAELEGAVDRYQRDLARKQTRYDSLRDTLNAGAGVKTR